MKSLRVVAFVVLVLGAPAAPAMAQSVPVPECVNNPACNQGSSCSVANGVVGARGGGALAALGLATVFAWTARRRAARAGV